MSDFFVLLSFCRLDKKTLFWNHTVHETDFRLEQSQNVNVQQIFCAGVCTFEVHQRSKIHCGFFPSEYPVACQLGSQLIIHFDL
jgi:hypothetical protein